MINKQNLWFITLFALILILGIYYISLPESTLPVFENTETKLDNAIKVTDSDVIIALKLSEEEKILIDKSSSKEKKNEAYNTLKDLNYKKGKTSQIENLIKEKFNLNSCVKIEGDKISVTVDDKDASVEKANNIIKEVQSLYDTQMYITVKFQNK